MRIMDRYLVKNFLAAYVICFISLVGLYIIIDLFSNADEFLEDHPGIVVFVRRAAKYYFVHSFEYFSRLSPMITVIAAMATLASLHRFNEVVAMLAAGVPTRRVLAPILGGCLFMISLGVINREICLPYYAEALQRYHEDIEAQHVLLPSTAIDKDQVLFRARGAHREDQRLEGMNITLPLAVAGQLQEVHAESAYYRPDPETGRMGWLLENPTPIRLLRPTEKLKPLPNGDYFLFSNVTFQEMIRRRDWMTFSSTPELLAGLRDEVVKNPQMIRGMIHARFMQPVLDLLLVLLGVPFVLQWERKDVYASIAVSMCLSGLFMVINTSSTYFANYGYIDPMTAAWIPVFIFGPLAMSLMHRIGT